MRTGLGDLLRYTHVTAIVGDILKIRAHDVGLGDMALVEMPDGEQSLAQTIQLEGDEVSLEVFGGGEGLSTQATVSFLGHPTQVTYSPNILGRVFRGDGQPMDGGPNLSGDRQVDSGGPSVNPVTRVVPTQMIRTQVPMIDVFNCLVESQKIPSFSVAGEPHNQLLARIAIQADADIIVFGGLGLIFDDYYFFRSRFEDEGIFGRTVMFVNLASDPIVERVLTPDLVLKVAERFAVEERKRVLVLMTDMTAYADALKEIGISMERVPSNRGYIGDLYSQLAVRYERACSYKGAGSVTILTVTTMPGNDVTHPVPDNTGYITEGQFYLHDGMIDPFGSLSRLKQNVIGTVTREDHAQVMNTMIRLYAGGKEAQQKQAMAFDLSAYDHKLIKFADAFTTRFMNLNVSMPRVRREPSRIRLIAAIDTAVDDDRARALDRVKATAARNIARKRWLPRTLGVDHADVVRRVTESYRFDQHLDLSAEHRRLIPDEVAMKVTIAGTPDDCIAKVRDLDQAGMTDIAICVTSQDKEGSRRTLERFAREVIPQV